MYEAGKVAKPIKTPPRDERGHSIGRKLKFTDLIGLANVDRMGWDGIGWDGIGSDGIGPPFEALRTYHCHTTTVTSNYE